MKVSTDGVMVGSWCNSQNATSILDIGTGTGLLAIMLAQKSGANIIAIDIDQAAVNQAIENIERTIWKNRIKVYKTSFQEFFAATTHRFDLIITNPPYFTNSKKASSIQRNFARHNDSLPFNELAKGVEKILSENGKFCLILPADYELDFICTMLDVKMYCSRLLKIRPKPYKQPVRIIMEFEKNPKCLRTEQTIIIEQTDSNQYTNDFKKLTNDFYM